MGERGRRTRVVHLSWFTRAEGAPGGVEKFASYLATALADPPFECRLVGWSRHPDAARLDGLPAPEKARRLGEWVEQTLEFDVAVADGYWGRGIRRKPVVAVVHGTWAELEWRMRDVAAIDLSGDIRAQREAFTAPNAIPVASSPSSARELEAHCGCRSVATICNAVDLSVFRPPLALGRGKRPTVLHSAHSLKKGADVLPAIADALGAQFSVEYLSAAIGEEPGAFARGDVFLHPSRHEGNAFALLEAMATGLPIVTTPVGLFESIPDRDVGRVLPVGAPAGDWAAAVREVWGDGVSPCLHYARRARQRACEVADFTRFAGEWRALLEDVVYGRLVRP